MRAGEVHLNLARQAIAEVHGRTGVEDTAIIEFLSDKERYLLLALEGDRVAGSLTAMPCGNLIDVSRSSSSMKSMCVPTDGNVESAKLLFRPSLTKPALFAHLKCGC